LSKLWILLSTLFIASSALAADPDRQVDRIPAAVHYGKVVTVKNTSSLPASVKAEIKRLVPILEQEKSGVCLVFVGQSGTVKTQAASLLATSLGKQAYAVDLAAVTSKYIGETEKNLNRLLDSATANHWVLLFDEADALFGKRTQVKDSHDRYANTETNYLRERLDGYKGIWVLTTNSRKQLDSRMKLRCKHIVKM
jgi:SpoVK/Ycf46/Vps4 family AAA+-type ATPase